MAALSEIPSPIEILVNPVSLAVLTVYAAMILWEALAPARALPRVAGWRRRGLASFAMYFLLSSYLPFLWDGALARYRLVDLSGCGVAGGSVVGLLVYELALYGWHRAMHRSNVLWRVFHQMHHSAERVDTTGAFYFSPTDVAGGAFLGSLVLVLGIGVAPGAAAIVLLTAAFLGIFQHTNVRTPRWLGTLIQRPESHTVHHARGVHDFNYSDLPIWDMLFGTFRNPAGYDYETGFQPGASARVWEMLTFRDVSGEAEGEPEMRTPRPQLC